MGGLGGMVNPSPFFHQVLAFVQCNVRWGGGCLLCNRSIMYGHWTVSVSLPPSFDNNYASLLSFVTFLILQFGL